MQNKSLSLLYVTELSFMFSLSALLKQWKNPLKKFIRVGPGHLIVDADFLGL